MSRYSFFNSHRRILRIGTGKEDFEPGDAICNHHQGRIGRYFAQVLGKQVLRSGTSVGANYREASRGRSKAEFISKIGDSLKEIEETEYWLELLVESGCLFARTMSDLLDETRQLIAIFTTIDKNSKRNL